PDVVTARRPRVLALRRARADPADDRLRLADRALAVRADDRRRPRDRRALRGRRQRDGARERLQRAQRQRGAGAALRHAGRGAQGGRRRRGARRPRLRRGDVVRHGAERRLRDRRRPADDGAERPRHDPRRHPLSAFARTRLSRYREGGDSRRPFPARRSRRLVAAGRGARLRLCDAGVAAQLVAALRCRPRAAAERRAGRGAPVLRLARAAAAGRPRARPRARRRAGAVRAGCAGSARALGRDRAVRRPRLPAAAGPRVVAAGAAGRRADEPERQPGARLRGADVGRAAEGQEPELPRAGRPTGARSRARLRRPLPARHRRGRGSAGHVLPAARAAPRPRDGDHADRGVPARVRGDRRRAGLAAHLAARARRPPGRRVARLSLRRRRVLLPGRPRPGVRQELGLLRPPRPHDPRCARGRRRRVPLPPRRRAVQVPLRELRSRAGDDRRPPRTRRPCCTRRAQASASYADTTTMTLLFGGCAAYLAYVYAGFPLLVLLRGRLRRRPFRRDSIEPKVSMVIAAYNEADVVGEKVKSVLSLDYPPERLEVVIASDGSDDGTAEIVRRLGGGRVRLLELDRGGKAAALNAAVDAATGDVLVFTDANSILDGAAVRELVGPLADPSVGGVAGNQVYLSPQAGDSSVVGEQQYWNFDRSLKQAQSDAGSVTGATGALYAIRRSLFRPVRADVNDDLLTSLRVIAQGYRLVFAPRAVAYEHVVESASQTFSRRVRVMARGLRCVVVMRELLDPRRYGFFSIQLLSHKLLLRTAVLPIVLLAVWNAVLWNYGWFYRATLIAQACFYVLGVLGIVFTNRPIAKWK